MNREQMAAAERSYDAARERGMTQTPASEKAAREAAHQAAAKVPTK